MTPATKEEARGNGQVTTGPESSTDRVRHSTGQAHGKSELPQFVRDMIASPPRHKDGVHQWLFRLARQLHAHRDTETIVSLLAAATDGCGRPVPESEIRDAVENSRASAWQPSGEAGSVRVAKCPPKWPSRDAARMDAIAEADPDALISLWKSSPVKISDELHDADCLLERLFPGNPLLCVSDGPARPVTRRRDALREISSGFSHIVPSPMSALRAINKKGGSSVRCLDNTGPRHYLVTEFDQDDKNTQAAIIRHLSRCAPLTMVVDSMGKSLHGWWYCKGQSEERIWKFFRMAVSLGADRAMWPPCQLARMPLGWRDEKNARQRVLYFDWRNTEAVKGGLQP